MFKYIEIINLENEEVTHRISVTGKSDRAIERMEDGLNINLNHYKFYTQVSKYDTEQVINPK